MSVLALAVVAAVSAFNQPYANLAGTAVAVVILTPRLARFRVDGPILFTGLLTTMAAVSLLWAPHPRESWYTVQAQIAVMMMLIAVREVVTNVRRLLVIAGGYLAGCLVVIVMLVRENADARFTAELSDTRYGVEGVNVNNLAFALATGLVVVILIWRVLSNPVVRLALLCAAAAMLFGIVQGRGRGALVGALLVGVWLVVHRLVGRHGVAVVAGFVAAASLAVPSGWATPGLLVADARSARSTGDLSNRLNIWPFARETFVDHWLFGIGAGGFRTIGPMWTGAHNVVLEIGTGLGVVGLFLFGGVVVSCLVAGTRGARDRSLLIGALLACWTPLWLSGHWELAPAAWIVMALFSRVGVLDAAADPPVGPAPRTGHQPGIATSVRRRPASTAASRR
jgi:O-antigen ligase